MGLQMRLVVCLGLGLGSLYSLAGSLPKVEEFQQIDTNLFGENTDPLKYFENRAAHPMNANCAASLPKTIEKFMTKPDFYRSQLRRLVFQCGSCATRNQRRDVPGSETTSQKPETWDIADSSCTIPNPTPNRPHKTYDTLKKWLSNYEKLPQGNGGIDPLLEFKPITLNPSDPMEYVQGFPRFVFAAVRGSLLFFKQVQVYTVENAIDEMENEDGKSYWTVGFHKIPKPAGFGMPAIKDNGSNVPALLIQESINVLGAWYLVTDGEKTTVRYGTAGIFSSDLTPEIITSVGEDVIKTTLFRVYEEHLLEAN